MRTRPDDGVLRTHQRQLFFEMGETLRAYGDGNARVVQNVAQAGHCAGRRLLEIDGEAVARHEKEERDTSCVTSSPARS